MEKRKISRFFAVVVVLVIGGLVASLYFGLMPSLYVKVIANRYSLEARGIGKIYPSKKQAKLVIGAAGGSSLEYLGLKYAFMKNLYFEDVLQWGVKNEHTWLVFQYFAEGRNKWLIVPVRGELMLRDDAGKSEEIDIQQLKKQLKVGEIYSLDLLYKYTDSKSNTEIHDELISKLIDAQNQTKKRAEWVLEDFPAITFTDEDLNKSLLDNGDLVVLNNAEIQLRAIGRY